MIFNFTLKPFILVFFTEHNSISTSFQLFPSCIPSSVYKSSFTSSFFLFTSFESSSITTANKRGFRADLGGLLLQILLIVNHQFLQIVLIFLQIFAMAKTSYSITPFFIAHHITLVTQSNAFSKVIKCHIQYSFCRFIFFEHLPLHKFCVEGSSSRYEPHFCIYFSFTTFVSRFFNNLLIAFMPCTKVLHFCNFRMISHLFL